MSAAVLGHPAANLNGLTAGGGRGQSRSTLAGSVADPAYSTTFEQYVTEEDEEDENGEEEGERKGEEEAEVRRLLTLPDEERLINTMRFVESPRKGQLVPNHILDTKIYSTIVRNKFMEASPSVLHFAGFNVGKSRRLKLNLINLSADVQRIHIIPPQTKYFRIEYTKDRRLVPGFALTCTVIFQPDECRYYYDCIRVHCKGDENLIIPIHAFPVLNMSDFPKFVDFGLVPVGESKTRVVPLRSEVPINFEFRLAFTQPHVSFTIDPPAGIVPANGEVDVSIMFSPTSFQTATATLQLTVSQFLSEPLICNLLGRSAPGILRDIALKSTHDDVIASSSSAITKLDLPIGQTLDPGMLSPLARARCRKTAQPALTARKTSSQQQQQQKASQIIQRDGFIIPPHLNTPYAVALVLNQKRGQLRMKDLQEALQLQKTGLLPMTRQMKETKFEAAIRQNVQEERQNQLCWQVKLGDEPVMSEYQDKVFEDRSNDWRAYQRLRGEVEDGEEEYGRHANEVLMRRTHRSASEVAPAIATFDAYANDMWATRQAILARFQQAARKIIVRRRMIPRLRALQKFLHDNAGSQMEANIATDDLTGDKSTQVKSTQVAQGLLRFSASDVKTVTFPIYVTPGVRDDLAVDALGPVSLVQGPVQAKTTTPYFPLQVPQYSQLYGYHRVDVQTASMNYVKPVSLKMLRTGEDDDLAAKPDGCQTEGDQIKKLPALVPSVTAEQLTEKDRNKSNVICSSAVPQGSAAAVEGSTANAVVSEPITPIKTICPPAAMFQPVKYPPLHIFNPAPGLLTFLSPLPYAENDPDFNFCPLPRFVAVDGDTLLATPMNQFTSMQKSYLDRQDVIKGLMTWKRFPSPAVTATTNCPTLCNVWVPRWGEAFNRELLPLGAPPLLHGLDEEDSKCIADHVEDGELDTSEDAVHLTFDMVKAEFSAMEAACLLDIVTEDPTAVAGGGKKEKGATGATELPAPKDIPFPHGSKLPPTNLPTSANGPVSRIKLEADLHLFLVQKRNNLGRKIDSRITSIDQLTKDSSLTLK